ncbi:MAG TPA: ABC transporter ATP-binding protein [Pyrinomonadaceae bacterium]|jgi:putative ABC transport system ATP-binding protein
MKEESLAIPPTDIPLIDMPAIDSTNTQQTGSSTLHTSSLNSHPLLETREVSKIYQMGSTQVTALDRVTMHAEQGEFVALQGTSGSGKSTLLNVLGGLDQPTSGEVFFEGKSLAPLSKKEMARYRRTSIGVIFQNFNLIPTMTAAENVSLALAFGGLRGRPREERARELLERVGLGDRLTHRPSELSGGEQQRVAIARALANRPRALLADEPTGNLDSTRAEELLALLREMVTRDRLTVLMVTHDRELAKHFADRIIFMKDGKVLEQ